MENKVDFLVEKMTDKKEREAYKYVEELAAIGTEESITKLLAFLKVSTGKFHILPPRFWVRWNKEMKL